MKGSRGIALPEVLVAFALLSFALFAALHQQARAHAEAGLLHERQQAVQLARDTVERLRAFAAPVAEPGLGGFDTIGSSTRVVDTAATRFTVHTAFAADADAPMKLGAVEVHWSDRQGAARQLRVPTAIDSALPLHAALLVQPARPGPVAWPHGRHAAIPEGAREAGGGRHLWSPGPASGHANGPAFLIDGLTGDIVSTCADAPPPDRAPTGCEPFQGRWLAGHVRFSETAPPDPHTPGDPLRPFDVALTLDAPAAPATCAVESVATPSDTTGSPAERFARYTCVVPLPPQGTGWSGRLDLVPLGWTLGPHRDHHRVCRYVADLDGSGAIDHNEEHPPTYANVTTSLVQQNFLVVRGDQDCPAGLPGPDAPHNVDLADTVPHQP
jgi:Tfp pilus assembly protein PilV